MVKPLEISQSGNTGQSGDRQDLLVRFGSKSGHPLSASPNICGLNLVVAVNLNAEG
jgi:hypothetical protein